MIRSRTHLVKRHPEGDWQAAYCKFSPTRSSQSYPASRIAWTSFAATRHRASSSSIDPTSVLWSIALRFGTCVPSSSSCIAIAPHAPSQPFRDARCLAILQVEPVGTQVDATSGKFLKSRTRRLAQGPTCRLLCPTKKMSSTRLSPFPPIQVLKAGRVVGRAPAGPSAGASLPPTRSRCSVAVVAHDRPA